MFKNRKKIERERWTHSECERSLWQLVLNLRCHCLKPINKTNSNYRLNSPFFRLFLFDKNQVNSKMGRTKAKQNSGELFICQLSMVFSVLFILPNNDQRLYISLCISIYIYINFVLFTNRLNSILFTREERLKIAWRKKKNNKFCLCVCECCARVFKLKIMAEPRYDEMKGTIYSYTSPTTIQYIDMYIVQCN